jgi:DNA-nicking Smr family endonuclease
MSPRRKPLTDQDRSDWARFVRDVAPLPGHAAQDLPAAEPPGDPLARPPAHLAPVPDKRPAPALAIGSHPAGLDNGSWNRFRSGKLRPARTLDLHGRTAERAFQALRQFLQTAHADRLRCVEVITGRGAGEAGGVIRRELPLWLNLPELRPLVLAASHPHAANPGAVRLLLRRPR